MKRNVQLYKNIILVLASALTLIAVTFAWFTTSYDGGIAPINSAVGSSLINVRFYEADDAGKYQPLNGDIALTDCVAGTFKQYKMIVTTTTPSALKMNFGITELPSDMPNALKDAVCIKYTVKKTTKSTAPDGTETYTDGVTIQQSTGEIPLSELKNGSIFEALPLQSYQSTSSDNFVIYYEIGLSENSQSAVEGMQSSLGNVRVSAQLAG